MKLMKAKGLVLRSISYGEYDKILTVLTEDAGKISVMVKGGKSINHGINANTLLFCYGNYILYEKGNMYILSSAEVIESFYDITKDYDKFAAASEMLAFINFTCDEGTDLGDLLRVTLNTLYALVHSDKSVVTAKAVFYTKICDVLGISPLVNMCAYCGDEKAEFFSADCGGMICSSCRQHVSDAKPISEQAAKIMEYILTCDIKKMFSFKAPEQEMAVVFNIIKEFIKIHLDYEL